MTRIILMVLGVALYLCAFSWLVVDMLTDKPEGRRVDCSMASFHPDIPKDAKQKCRGVKP